MISRETVIERARQFVKRVGVDEIPVDVSRFARAVNAEIKIDHTMGETEPGSAVALNDSLIIVVNGNDREERRRFTILHEIAHIVLELPSQHGETHAGLLGSTESDGRPREEMLCDTFATECLFPREFFESDIASLDVTLETIKWLAQRYAASITATGIHVVANGRTSCAFVLIRDGKIYSTSVSETLRVLGGKIKRTSPLPYGSAAYRLLSGDQGENQSYAEVTSDVWFGDSVDRGYLWVEEAFLAKNRRECLSLIRVSESSNAATNSASSCYIDEEEDEEPLLEELDGNLTWPSRGRRR